MIAQVISVLGSVFSGFLNLKQGQQQTIEKAFDIISDASKADEARAVAAAQIISAEANSSSWLVQNWRPITALTFLIILVGYFFGWWNPEEHVDAHVVDRIFDIIEYSVLGYGGARSLDKWVKEITTNKTIIKIIENTLSKK
jgi:hypothetical protein